MPSSSDPENKTHDLTALLADHASGKQISLGPGVALRKGFLHLHGALLYLATLDALQRDERGAALLRRNGLDEPPFVIRPGDVTDIELFVELVNHLIASIPQEQRRQYTGWPQGSIGEGSDWLGTDMRELLIAGYTDEQIRGVLRKEYTLDELYRRKPKGKPMTLR
jgi:hypothetical protein